MKGIARTMLAGVVVLAVASFAIQDEANEARPGTPARTKANEGLRQAGQGRPIQNPVSPDDLALAPDVTGTLDEIRRSAESARSIVSPALREEMTRRAVQDWAERDAGEAMAWAAGLPDEYESRVAMQHVCIRLAAGDPPGALRLAWQYKLDDGPGNIMAGLVSVWAECDLEGARIWVSSQAAGELRDGLTGPVAFQLAKTDPAAAARMVTEQMEAGELQAEAVVSVLCEWMAEDRRAAESWLETFQDGELKARAYGELLSGR